MAVAVALHRVQLCRSRRVHTGVPVHDRVPRRRSHRSSCTPLAVVQDLVSPALAVCTVVTVTNVTRVSSLKPSSKAHPVYHYRQMLYYCHTTHRASKEYYKALVRLNGHHGQPSGAQLLPVLLHLLEHAWPTKGACGLKRRHLHRAKHTHRRIGKCGTCAPEEGFILPLSIAPETLLVIAGLGF